MIPDHLIRRAAQAALAKGVYGEPDSDDLLDDMHPADLAATLDTTRAALEAVAADIWDEGWEAGMSYVISLERGIDDDENVSNPYERNENA